MAVFKKVYQRMELIVEDGIAQVILNSPPVNAITSQFMDDLDEVMDELTAMEDIRVVVIGSGLEKVFVAGADIKAFQYMDGEGTMAVSRRGNPVFDRIENFPSPVICAVNGVAFGGGLELALACDIRIFDERAKAGLPETSLGIIPGYSGSQRLPRIVGEAQAKRMLFTAMPVKAEEAFRIGLAQVVAPHGTSMEEAVKMARMVAGNGPLAVQAAKRCIHAAREMDLKAGAAYETSQGGLLFETQDKTEGMTAFLEKRSPKFQGR